MARRLVGQDAEDLVQEALLHAYRHFDQLHDRDAASAWLATILVNAYRDRVRAARRRVEEVLIDSADRFSLYRHLADEDPFPYSDSLHLDFIALLSREDVQAVLLLLPEIYRVPLVLHYVEGYATKEIAHLLGAPLGTILARLHRGRKLFERGLWDYAESQSLLESRTSPAVPPRHQEVTC
jgi:RNA polymerase sigma-70 factor (ECF subfamily)